MKSYFGPLKIRIWGERACFTRPDSKADRVSYPIITPSAARGVLEAVYWHPQMYWRVTKIWNMKPVKWFSLMANETTGDKGVNKNWEAMNPFEISRYRDQRHMLGLRDVEYIVFAEVVARDGSKSGEAKHRDIFQRRLKKGACAYQPFLGCREFTGYFSPAQEEHTPVSLPEEDLGQMVGSLFDLTVDPQSKVSAVSRRVFEAVVRDGVLVVDPKIYEPGAPSNA